MGHNLQWPDILLCAIVLAKTKIKNVLCVTLNTVVINNCLKCYF